MRTNEAKENPTAMEVRTEVRPGYLRVILEGEFQLKELQTIAKRIFDFCFQAKKVKVLVDARKVTGRPSLLTKIDLADSMVEKQMEYIVKGAERLRIAHVLAEGIAEPKGFGETLAANRGGKIFVTTSMEEALRWLDIQEESLT